jgi:hypothetical protein
MRDERKTVMLHVSATMSDQTMEDLEHFELSRKSSVGERSDVVRGL